MDKKKVTLRAEDGTEVEVVIPTSLPTQERGEYLRELYSQYVQNDGHWKGENAAVVPEVLADDVGEAMGFMGAEVDARVPGRGVPFTFGRKGCEKTVKAPKGFVVLHSRGYWAHGY